MRHWFGIEFYDLEARKMVSDDRWFRSAWRWVTFRPTAAYHTPDPCACWLGAGIRGFHAMGPQAPAIDYDKVNESEQLERGPAYGGIRSRKPEVRRMIGRRIGTTSAQRPSNDRAGRGPQTGVEAPLGGKLTPPVVAAGRVYVSRQDANEVVCLDAGSGDVRWRYSTPSYVDSPPTVVDARLLCGCADGQVYCLNAADGALIWRFRAAPAEMMIVDDSRVASKWPVHGSVLVKDGIAFCTAGRSSFLDGGIQVVKLDVATGKLLGHARLDGPWHDLFQVNTIVPSEESGQAGPPTACARATIRRGSTSRVPQRLARVRRD